MARAAGLTLMAFLVAVARAAPPAANDDNVEVLLARMDGVWERRDADGAIPDLVSLAMIAQNMDPQNYQVEWRLARAYFWVAYTQSNRIAKKAMAGKAIETAQRARSWRPDRVEGHYFYAVAAGEYASAIGVVQALMDGIAGKVESAALRAAEIDRDFDHGAPLTVLGRYYYMLPWPKRDLPRSRRYLEEVVARHPRTLIARDYLADTYYALGEREKAREQLIVVLTSDVPPGRELEREAPKALARESMQRWFPEPLPESRPVR